MKKKMSFSTLIVVSVVITLLTSLQIAASSPSVQSNPHPTIEIRPLQDSVTVTPQPFAHTSEDYVQVQDAIASVLSNYPTASLTDIKIDGQWAYGIVKLADTNEFFALAHLLPNGVWQVALPDNGTIYTQWLDTLPENLIPLTEKETILAELELSFSDFDNPMLQGSIGWEIFTDPYWAFSVSHPSNWNIQNIPYQDFGFRINSPDLIVDELGKPLQGAFLSAFVTPMHTEEWENYVSQIPLKNDVDWIQILDIDEGEGKQFTGLDQDNNYFVEQIFYINGYFYDFRFIQATNTLAYLDIGYEMLSSIVLDGVPESYPSPDYSALGINLENFNFQPIKIPFQNGTGNITSGGGYNNGSNHNYYDKYALDVCENGTCSQNDRYAIAPTDITFVHTASNQTDYHFFEIDNDGSNKLCMSLAHFNFGNFGVPIVSGMHFPRGAVLGPLSNYSPPHLHIGIWSVPASSNCWYGTRTAITFEGSYQLNGVSYGACWPTGNDCYNVHANRPVTSTNYPICAMPSMNGNITNTEINEVQAITTSPGDCFGSGTLDPPALISPNNGERLTNRSVHFVWQSPNSTNQNGYTFRLNSSSNPDTQPWIEDTGLGNEYTSYGYELPSDGTFYWHMRTWNTSNEASAWVTRQFHIDTSGGSDDVVLCGTDDASSDCWIFPLGVYSDLSTWGLNDRMRSAIVPSGKSVFLFREGGLRGTAECFSGNRIPLPSGDPWDLRGQVTGVQVFHQSGCPTSQLYSVVMYDNQNYGSHHWGIGYNEGVHNLNQIGGPDDAYFNDRGESVRIPSGWSVRLYEHNDRGGQSSGCLTGDVSSLGSLNNTVSSVELFHNTSCTPPTPIPPTNLSVSGTTENSISLAWQDNSNIETGFKIYRWGWNGTDWDFFYLNSVGANVTTYTDTGLNCGESYFYTVSANNGGSESSQASWVQGDTNVCPNVEITGAWTGDGDWNPKSTFDPDDSIQWGLTVVNTTGADADIELSYDAYGPNGEHILDWTGMVTVSNGGWNIALRGTVPNGMGGTHAFDGLGDYQGHITLATTTYFVTGPSAPVNNDFNTPISINYVPFNYTQTVAGATSASDDPSFNCGSYFSGTGFQSLWYRYTPSTNDFLSVNTFGSEYDTILAIWTGQRGNLQLQGCNDDSNGGLQSQAATWAFAGTTYYIEVLSYSDGGNGSLTLKVSADAPNHIYLPLITR